MSRQHDPGPDCYEFMRRTLLEDLDELYNEPPREKDWRVVTADAGVPFPTPAMLKLDNWMDWHQAVIEQVRNASDAQIATYYDGGHERGKYSECPACGWSRS